MTSKQRAYLRSLAMTMEPIFQIGKSSLTPEFTTAINEALEARELIKITILESAYEDTRDLCNEIAKELGVLDQVLENGWKSLSAKDTGRIGGMMTGKKKRINKENEKY
mgnify:CR=1 FL=1